MGGAGRLSDLNWMLQQSICTAGFSKQFPDDGGGEMERKRQKWQCSNTICLVSEQLYISWFILQQVLLFKSAVLLHFNTFFKAVLVCFFSFSLLYKRKIGACFWPRLLPLAWFSSRSMKQHQCREHGEVRLGPRLHLYNIIPVDSPFVSLISESLFYISAAWISSAKILLKGRDNRNSRTWTKYLCVCLKQKSTLNTVTQLLAACFTCLGPFRSLMYIYSCCG